jgi:hypothetical protein
MAKRAEDSIDCPIRYLGDVGDLLSFLTDKANG